MGPRTSPPCARVTIILAWRSPPRAVLRSAAPGIPCMAAQCRRDRIPARVRPRGPSARPSVMGATSCETMGPPELPRVTLALWPPAVKASHLAGDRPVDEVVQVLAESAYDLRARQVLARPGGVDQAGLAGGVRGPHHRVDEHLDIEVMRDAGP